MTGFVKATPLVLPLVLLLSISAGVSVPTAIAHADSGDRAAPVALYNATDGANWTNNTNWLSDAPISEGPVVAADSDGDVIDLSSVENDSNGPIPAELGNLANLVNLDPGGSNQFTGSIPDASQDVATKDLSEINLPFSSAVLTDPGRDDLDQPIRPPVAPAYMDWRWEGGQGGFREVTTDFTIHNDVGDFSDQHGFYLILMQNSISDVGFYFGLQTDANGRGKGLIFSRWKTRDLANAKHDDTYGWTESSGHEGDFIGVRRSYEWSAGDYRIRVAPDGLAPDGEWFGLWITDLNTGVTSWIGSLKFPLSDGTAVIEPRSSATIELYGVEPIRPIDVPQWHVSVKRPLGDGVPSTWGYTSYPFDDSENALPNSDVLYDSPEDAAHLHVGGTTERVTPATARIDFEPMPASGTPPPGAHPDDFAALVALYNATDGANWTNNSNWLSDRPLREWHGVRTEGNGPVTGLYLSSNQLSGAIPPELGGLSNLERLYLSSNQLRGEIPPELGDLSSLEYLDLQGNQLSGEIPPELGNLAFLEYLNLGYNNWGGGGNDLTGEIPPELGDLSSLEYLDLSGNQLTGEVPPELGNLSSLVRMSLSRNQLSGEIPPELGNLARLEWMSLSGNQLTGEIPPELGNLARLGSLNLSYNQLSGEIPPELGLGSLAFLGWMSLSGNQLTGEIPPELGNLTRLGSLGLRYNQLTGEIPPELGSLAFLETLYLSGNQLSGEIPPELGNLTRLGSLHLNETQLSGEIPPELGNLASLETLYLYETQLSGEIPPELGNLTRLGSLHLYESQLSGEIPPELGNLANLEILYLSYNQLTGEIPPELGNLTSLRTLYLNYNQLTGEIPPELGNLTSLRWLDLNENQLSGEIPPELGNLANLEILDLSYNQLTGEIPPELGNLTSLRLLNLRINDLTGCIPDGLRNATLVRPVPVLGFCPGAPKGLTAVASGTGAAVNLSWTAPAFTGASHITGYRIQASPDGNDPWTDVPTSILGNVTAYTDDGADEDGPRFAAGEWLHYRVAAVNAAGTGRPSNVAIATPDACRDPLGLLTAPVTKTGVWAADCASEARSGSYARYYSFTLDQAGQVEINLTSSADPYLALRQGEGRDGTIEDSNDNVGSRNFNSSINRMLAAGTYTVEATTYFAKQTGDFTLSVRPLQETEDLGPLTRSVDRSNSAWTSNHESTQQMGSYARYYTFTLYAATHVVINLTSPEDPYLFLLDSRGAVVHKNDNVTTRNLNSRIDETLPAGTYTIEATTYFEGLTGSFHLSIGYFGAPQ